MGGAGVEVNWGAHVEGLPCCLLALLDPRSDSGHYTLFLTLGVRWRWAPSSATPLVAQY